MSDAYSFDLLDRPWMPCGMIDGQIVTLGIRDLLLQSPKIAELRDESPLTKAALLRLLLAVLHAVYRGPGRTCDRAEIWQAGEWDAHRLNMYFQRWADRFDLFSDEYPFYQAARFAVAPTSVAKLAPELVTGNSTRLFDHSLDAAPPALDPATAARWMVTYQAFALGGGQGATSALFGKHPNLRLGPAAQGALVTLRGESLFRTLLLNLLPYSRQDPIPTVDLARDKPLWECDSFPLPVESPPAGYLSYLTFPSRCLRLRREQEGDESVVRMVDLAQGPYFSSGQGLRDPFMPMRATKKGEIIPLRLSAERSLWRDSGSLFEFSAEDEARDNKDTPVVIVRKPAVFRYADLLSQELGERLNCVCEVVGMDFDQAKITLWRVEELPLPEGILRDVNLRDIVMNAVREGEAAGRILRDSLSSLARRLINPEKPAGADSEMVKALTNSWGGGRMFWPELDQPFRELLRDLETDNSAPERWIASVWRSLSRAYYTAEVQAGAGPREFRARAGAERLFRGLMYRRWPELARPAEQLPPPPGGLRVGAVSDGRPVATVSGV